MRLDLAGRIKSARKTIEESYCGCHTSVADYAQELTEDTGNIPSHLEMYIDYERMGRDMEHARDEHSEGPHATVASGGLCCGRRSVLFVRRLARGADLGGVQGERSLHGRRRGKGGG